ncbi:MAG: amidohydrolase family protein [Spirochaetaceae bacterium]|jgi:predicted amidohydrolase YtcJ|nr:amidohydrolase family protein [Spirochaetaceae bacterium]
MTIYKGNILSCDNENRKWKYLIEHKGIIRHLCDELPQEFQGKPVIDLGDKTLLPALGDGHIHFSNWALLAASQFDVRKAENIKGIQQIISRFMDSAKKPKVVIGFGISRHSLEEGRLITRQELDQVCPEVPMMLICYDGHSSIANSSLMDLFPEEFKGLRGFHEQTGQLFQVAYFSCTDFATSLVPTGQLIKSILKGFDLLAERGIGMMHCVEGIGFPGDADVTLVSLAARAMARKTGFQTRLSFQTMDLNKIRKRKLSRVGGCFATAIDGCFGACDAALQEPYTDDPENLGILFQEEEELMSFVRDAHKAGLQISLHTIGDAAVKRAVNAFEIAQNEFPREDCRHILIHACLIQEEDMKRIMELNLTITLQPSFLASPLEPLSYLKEILGDRINTGSPLKRFLQEGIPLSGGSDGPVTHPDPIEGLTACMNHPYDPKQSLTMEEALKLYTSTLCYSSFDQGDRGTLEAGKIADMTLLNCDPLKLGAHEVKEKLKVEQLYLKGKKYKGGMTIAGLLIRGLFGRKVKI